MNTCVIIPAYNEEKTIGAIVKKIKDTLALSPVVIDDGSTDATAKAAADGGASVVTNKDNVGKGASLIKGFEYALSRGFDSVITMDADGQHLPEDIPFFIKRARDSAAGIFIGNRMSKVNNMPSVRVITNKVMSFLISTAAKQKIPDSQCGFRLIRKEVLEGLRLSTRRYETESELLLEAAKRGFAIESVPVTTVYENETSHINPFVDTLRFIKFIIPYLWTMRR